MHHSYKQKLKSFSKSLAKKLGDGLFLIMFVVNECYLEELYLGYLLNCFESNFCDNSHRICALVQTCCDSLTDTDIKRNFEKNYIIQKLVDISKKGAIGVTFPTLEGIDDIAQDYIKRKIAKSEKDLNMIVESCNEMIHFDYLLPRPEAFSSSCYKTFRNDTSTNTDSARANVFSVLSRNKKLCIGFVILAAVLIGTFISVYELT